jgi:chitinase
LNSPSGDNWKQYKSEFAPLPDNLKGKKVIIGWYHRSRDDSSPAWQIIDTELRDIPELL